MMESTRDSAYHDSIAKNKCRIISNCTIDIVTTLSEIWKSEARTLKGMVLTENWERLLLLEG